MNGFLLVVAQNIVAAFLLALLVGGLTRLVRIPPLAHMLWLLVLVKLVSPPLVRVDWLLPDSPGSTRERGRPVAESHRRAAERNESLPVGRPAGPSDAQDGLPGRPTDAPAYIGPIPRIDPEWADGQVAKTIDVAGPARFWPRVAPVVVCCWGGSVALLALLAVARIVRFERALRGMLPASDAIERLARETAGKLGVRRIPAVLLSESVEVPLLWCVFRPTIVLPTRLLQRLDERQLALVLAHELAHLRRCDHWLRGFELVVEIIYWWNPLVGFVRRRMHEAEELCCDAWVRWALPQDRKAYAEVVLKAAESFCASQAGKLLPASPFLRSLSLKERIEMILESQFQPRVSPRSMLLISVIAVFVLPTFVRFTRREAAAQDEKPPVAVQSEAAGSQFPYTVKFEQGATKFLKGDKITILEVRGTAETFTPGDIYWIRGTYTLASHEAATLAAFTTAKHATDGRSKSYTAQTTKIEKGDGTFALFLPMACEGWPHVSFYSANDGEGFGGNYFGTGESVLKQWWGSKEADPPANDETSAKQSQTSRSPWRAFGRATDADGRPLAGVEIQALSGSPTPGIVGAATSDEDGRYEMDFNPGIGPNGSKKPAAQSALTLIRARKAGYFEENLNRHGKRVAAAAMPDEAQLKPWGVGENRVVLPGRPLELNFLMRQAASVVGRLVDEGGQPLVGYSVSLQGPDRPPASSVVSDARTDEQGRFLLEDVPTAFRYQFVVRKAKPRPPWNDSWASAALRFDQREKEGLHAWFGAREIRLAELVMRLSGEGIHGKTATRLAGNAGALDLTAENAEDVLEQSDTRLAAKSAVLTLSNTPSLDLSRSLIKERLPSAPAVAYPTHLARGRPNEAGEFTISFENPPGFDLARGKHQVIFQVFVGVSHKPLIEKIFRQLEIEEGRYEVPVKIAPELGDDSRVSITFVTIQPEHDAWVKTFFQEGKRTTYRGIWTSDGDILPAVPYVAAGED